MPKSSRALGRIKGEVVAFKRERIVDAAVDLFYERGYEHTTLDAVAQRLGVTKPFIYSYFESKSDLLSEICSRGIKASLDAVDEILALKLGPVDQLNELAKKFTCAVLQSQKHIAVFSREEKNLTRSDFERISNMRREFDRKLSTLLDRGVAKGEFQARDTKLVALAIGGMISWSYVWYRSSGRLSLLELAEEMAELILRMVQKPPMRPADSC
jgi:AcrR family transcriptional regulator